MRNPRARAGAVMAALREKPGDHVEVCVATDSSVTLDAGGRGLAAVKESCDCVISIRLQRAGREYFTAVPGAAGAAGLRRALRGAASTETYAALAGPSARGRVRGRAATDPARALGRYRRQLLRRDGYQ